MNLKIHATLPGSDFSLNTSLNLLSFPALLNKLFRRAAHVQVETSVSLTLKQAYELHLIEQGWLPDILPASAHRIRMLNNPCLKCAQGEFCFDASDWQSFSAKLRSEKMMEAPFINWAKSLRTMQDDGHSLWHYPATGRHWVFFCKEEGHCEYVMWMCEDRVS